MKLLADIEARIGAEASPFRAQLLREDLERLKRLRGLAGASADRTSFLAAGRRLGWTQGDQRTAELAPVLDPLLEAVYAYEHGAAGEAAERRIGEAWLALTSRRIETLVGCLSTRILPPEE